MSIPAYQKYYQKILNDSSIPLSIQHQNDYNSPQHLSHKQIFPLCKQNDTPQFFKSNLLSPNRIIKYLVGDYCVYRAFYFQLFKLMFEIENEEKDYLELFKEIIFDPEIIQRNGENSRAKRQNSRVKAMGQNGQNNDTSRVSEMNSQQAFKHQFQTHQKCIASFIQKVLQNSMNFTSFQHYLPYCPQVDQSMVLILQTFIQNASQNEQMDSIQTIWEYLCEIFEIQLVVIENCFKFQESDVFLYIEQKQDEQVWVYIAFNQITEDQEQAEGQDGVEEENERQAEHLGEKQQVFERSLNQNQEHYTEKNYQQNRQCNGYQFPVSDHAYPDQIYNSYISSSNQNQSLIRDKQSSSFKDQVITSQMKPQSSSQKYIDQFNRPKEFQNDQGGQNRPNRISSEMNKSQSQRYQTGDHLTKSNHLPNSNINSNRNVADTLSNQISISSKLLESQNDHKNQSIQSQQKDLIQNSTRQDRNFQKKVRYFDEDSIVESQNPSAKQLFKQQSHTEPYQQDAYHRQPDRDKGSFNGKSQNEVSSSSFKVIDPSQSARSTENRRVSESRADTIINMFGDMLSSSGNLNAFDPMHGSSSSIGNGFVTSSHHKLHAEQDTSNPYNKHSYSKNYQNAYGTSNHISVTNNIAIQGNSNNQVNMKKIKSESQIVFEAKPKDSVNAFSKVEIRENTVRNNGFSQQNNNSSSKILMDSEELRNNQNTQNATQQYFPFANINLSQQQSNQYNITTKQQSYSSPQNSDRDYLQNIQARTFIGEQNRSNHNRSNPGSFHNSSRGSTKSQQIGIEPPNIKVNSIKSESQTSSKELNKRNNYYENDDFGELDRDISIKSEEEQLERNYGKKEYFNNHIQQEKPSSRSKFLNQHQYKSQQNVRVPVIQSPNLSKAHSRAYTSNNQSIHNPSKIKQAENTEQQDFFFHPSNKSSIKYGLKTIQEVRASRETNKESYKIGDASKISNGNKLDQAEDRLNKYELVNSVEGLAYSTNGVIKQQKTTTAINKLLDTNAYKFKQTKNESKQLNDESVNNGTFYKQFTNSKVLKLLKQPYKTKVQILKNRFKGEHRTAISKNIIT